MLIAFDEFGQPLNDFQSNSTEEGLLANAELKGIDPDSVKIQDVSEEEFVIFEERVNGPVRLAREEQEKLDMIRAKELQSRLGLSDQDVSDLKMLLR